jgi:hypothetical protein
MRMRMQQLTRTIVLTGLVAVAAAGCIAVPVPGPGHAHPGGNITGLTTMAAELTAKRLEFLKAIAPTISRVWMSRAREHHDGSPTTRWNG